MSKSERDAFYSQEAFEFEKQYEGASTDEEITLPLTRDGFERLLVAVCAAFQLPADDGSRSTLAGYIHHIPPNQHTSSLNELGIVLHKAISNSMTWQIDQDVKQRRAEEDAKSKEESTLKVVGDSPDGPTPEGA